MVTILHKLTTEITATVLLLILLALVSMVWNLVDTRSQGLHDSFDNLHREMLIPLSQDIEYPSSWWGDKITVLENRYPELRHLRSMSPAMDTLVATLKTENHNPNSSKDLGNKLLALQELETNLEDLARRNYRTYQISTMALSLLLLASLGVFGFRLYKISMAVDKAMNHKRILDSAMILQEKERYRMARELHDGVAQEIAHARMIAMGQEAAIGASIILPLNKALQEIRWMCGSLRVPQDENRRLAQMVAETVSNFRERYTLDLEYVEAISDQIPWTHLYIFEINRIIQEGLLNIARHSDSSHAALKLVETGSKLRILIEDTGRGLGSSTRGFGMEGISERADLLSGSARWDSPLTGGTRLVVEIPIPEHNSDHTTT